ncbi:MAG: glycosyltransferase family 4 protein [Actinobacteria bacterium]|nr:glycosyltransferase family 4 protein [Actinomycetota bacterium]
MTAVYVVVPDGVDDPARPSGGNTYDRRVCRGLADLGWVVHECPVPGPWPRPDDAANARLARVIAAIPVGSVVLLDGLIASSAPEALVPEAARLRLVVVVHLPLGTMTDGPVDETREREQAVLAAAAAVVATSAWTRRWLLEHYALAASAVHVAEPGVDAAGLAPGTPAGGALLCVAAVAPHKGHDVLVAALARITDLDWRCLLVGALDRDAAFVQRLTRQAADAGVADRMTFAGPLAGAGLDHAYAAADVLVLASHAETYAMVVTEALAHGLPVLATAVGGLPQAVGRATGGRPSLLVRPGDPDALAAALRCWLTDPGLRGRLRDRARERRATLAPWSTTSARIDQVLTEVAA